MFTNVSQKPHKSSVQRAVRDQEARLSVGFKPNNILQLQRTFGNKATQALLMSNDPQQLMQRCSCGGKAEEHIAGRDQHDDLQLWLAREPMERNLLFHTPSVQRLVAGEDDPYEQEADHASEAVLNNRQADVSLVAPHGTPQFSLWSGLKCLYYQWKYSDIIEKCDKVAEDVWKKEGELVPNTDGENPDEEVGGEPMKTRYRCIQKQDPELFGKLLESCSSFVVDTYTSTEPSDLVDPIDNVPDIAEEVTGDVVSGDTLGIWWGDEEEAELATEEGGSWYEEATELAYGEPVLQGGSWYDTASDWWSGGEDSAEEYHQSSDEGDWFGTDEEAIWEAQSGGDASGESLWDNMNEWL